MTPASSMLYTFSAITAGSCNVVEPDILSILRRGVEHITCGSNE